MLARLFFFKSLFPHPYRVAMAAVLLLIAFFILDAVIELSLQPGPQSTRPAQATPRKAR